MRKILHESLYINTSSKAIICSNVPKSLTTLQDEVRIWTTDPSSFVCGTTDLVVGDEDTLRKNLYNVQFTRCFETAYILNTNIFTPRVLIDTSGFIGSGVDFEDVTLVACMGCQQISFISFKKWVDVVG